MGRNFHSVCHQCKVSLMHLRGKEGDLMQKFAREHQEHEKQTEIYNDYIEDTPDEYTDIELALGLDNRDHTSGVKLKENGGVGGVVGINR